MAESHCDALWIGWLGGLLGGKWRVGVRYCCGGGC